VIFGHEDVHARKINEVWGRILASLHFAVDDSRILTFFIDMKDFGNKRALLESRIEDMIDVDRKKMQEAILASGRNRVNCAIMCRPCIGCC